MLPKLALQYFVNDFHLGHFVQIVIHEMFHVLPGHLHFEKAGFDGDLVERPVLVYSYWVNRRFVRWLAPHHDGTLSVVPLAKLAVISFALWTVACLPHTDVTRSVAWSIVHFRMHSVYIRVVNIRGVSAHPDHFQFDRWFTISVSFILSCFQLRLCEIVITLQSLRCANLLGQSWIMLLAGSSFGSL